MKKTLTLLLTSTALITAVTLPAWSSISETNNSVLRTIEKHIENSAHAMPLIFVSDDEDRRSKGARRYHDEDEEDDDEDDEHEDCDDDKDCDNNAQNPAPAGSVTPPQNGLFGTGAAPKVQMK